MLVQFANNWMKNFSESKIGLVQFGCPRNVFIQLFTNWTACSPIDLSKVSVAILAGVQSRQKLQQMYGKLFNFQTL